MTGDADDEAVPGREASSIAASQVSKPCKQSLTASAKAWMVLNEPDDRSCLEVDRQSDEVVVTKWRSRPAAVAVVAKRASWL
jgi:hypothetical protein